MENGQRGEKLGTFEIQHHQWFLNNIPRTAKGNFYHAPDSLGIVLLNAHLLFFVNAMRPEMVKKVFEHNVSEVFMKDRTRYYQINISWSKTDQEGIKRPVA